MRMVKIALSDDNVARIAWICAILAVTTASRDAIVALVDFSAVVSDVEQVWIKYV